MFPNNVSKFSANVLRFNRANLLNRRWRSVAAAAAPEDTDNAPLDAFEILNVERKFDIPQATLKQSYRTLMGNLHPDKHHGKPLAQQQALQQQASQVTQSYQILKEAPTRATHMLQLLGKMDPDDDEASMRELLGAAQGNKLLMEVMEIREAIEDAASDEELNVLLEENLTRMETVCEKLASAFREQLLDRALELAVMLQYYNRIDETIRAKL